MFGLGAGELAVMGGIVLLLFGGKKIPELGSAMGKGIKNFQAGLKQEENKLEDNSQS